MLGRRCWRRVTSWSANGGATGHGHVELADELQVPARAAQEARGGPVVQGPAEVERVDHRADEPHVVEQRQPRQPDVGRPEVPVLTDRGEVRQQRAVADHHALGVAGRPRRRLHERVRRDARVAATGSPRAPSTPTTGVGASAAARALDRARLGERRPRARSARRGRAPPRRHASDPTVARDRRAAPAPRPRRARRRTRRRTRPGPRRGCRPARPAPPPSSCAGDAPGPAVEVGEAPVGARSRGSGTPTSRRTPRRAPRAARSRCATGAVTRGRHGTHVGGERDATSSPTVVTSASESSSTTMSSSSSAS